MMEGHREMHDTVASVFEFLCDGSDLLDTHRSPAANSEENSDKRCNSPLPSRQLIAVEELGDINMPNTNLMTSMGGTMKGIANGFVANMNSSHSHIHRDGNSSLTANCSTWINPKEEFIPMPSRCLPVHGPLVHDSSTSFSTPRMAWSDQFLKGSVGHFQGGLSNSVQAGADCPPMERGLSQQHPQHMNQCRGKSGNAHDFQHQFHAPFVSNGSFHQFQYKGPIPLNCVPVSSKPEIIRNHQTELMPFWRENNIDHPGSHNLASDNHIMAPEFPRSIQPLDSVIIIDDEEESNNPPNVTSLQDTSKHENGYPLPMPNNCMPSTLVNGLRGCVFYENASSEKAKVEFPCHKTEFKSRDSLHFEKETELNYQRNISTTARHVPINNRNLGKVHVSNIENSFPPSNFVGKDISPQSVNNIHSNSKGKKELKVEESLAPVNRKDSWAEVDSLLLIEEKRKMALPSLKNLTETQKKHDHVTLKPLVIFREKRKRDISLEEKEVEFHKSPCSDTCERETISLSKRSSNILNHWNSVPVMENGNSQSVALLNATKSPEECFKTLLMPNDLDDVHHTSICSDTLSEKGTAESKPLNPEKSDCDKFDYKLGEEAGLSKITVVSKSNYETSNPRNEGATDSQPGRSCFIDNKTNGQGDYDEKLNIKHDESFMTDEEDGEEKHTQLSDSGALKENIISKPKRKYKKRQNANEGLSEHPKMFQNLVKQRSRLTSGYTASSLCKTRIDKRYLSPMETVFSVMKKSRTETIRIGTGEIISHVEIICRFCNEAKRWPVRVEWPDYIFLKTCCPSCKVNPKYVNRDGRPMTTQFHEHVTRIEKRVKKSPNKYNASKQNKRKANVNMGNSTRSNVDIESEPDNQPSENNDDSDSSCSSKDGTDGPDTTSCTESEEHTSSSVEEAEPVYADLFVDNSELMLWNKMSFDQSLECDDCSYSSQSLCDMVEHTWHKHNQRNCGTCSKTFLIPQQYYNHKKHHVFFKRTYCYSCKSYITNYPKHLKSDHKILFCILCGYKFSHHVWRDAKQHYEFHEMMERVKHKLSCPEITCGFHSDSADLLLKHMWTFHKEKACPFCETPESYDIFSEMLIHVYSVHKNNQEIIDLSVTNEEECRKKNEPTKLPCSTVKLCEICHYPGEDVLNLVKHKMLVHSMNPQSICGKDFLLPQQVEKWLIIQKINEYSCWICEQNMADTVSLAIHLRDKHSEQSLVCFQKCYDLDDQIGHLREHSRLKLSEMSCPYLDCAKLCSSAEDLLWHLFKTHLFRRCLFCKEDCTIFEVLWNHTLLHVSSYSTEEYMKCKFVGENVEFSQACTFCSFKSPTIELIYFHLWYHHGARFCHICHGRPSLKGTVPAIYGYISHQLQTHCEACFLCHGHNEIIISRQHREVFHGMPLRKILECKLCGQTSCNFDFAHQHKHESFETPGELKQIHVCDQCGKIYDCITKLRNHKFIKHERKKNLLCEVCGLSFDDNSIKKAHMRIHSGERPFECKICTQKFARSDNLNTHMRSHTGMKPYQCQVCSKCFTRGDNLKTHVKKMH